MQPPYMSPPNRLPVPTAPQPPPTTAWIKRTMSSQVGNSVEQRPLQANSGDARESSAFTTYVVPALRAGRDRAGRVPIPMDLPYGRAQTRSTAVVQAMATQQVQTEPPTEPAQVATAPPARRVVRLRNPFTRTRSQRDLAKGRFSETTLGEGHMSAANYRRDAIYRRFLAAADVAAAVIAVPVGIQLVGNQ